MQFLYPAFLWALTALSIPIILHLFYFRRYKKVYFSNLKFLREVTEETSARNRLRNLLILLSRLLAMAFVILAFAQPIIPLEDSIKAGIRNVSVFVDNSFSMQSFGEELSLFDRARQKAQEIIKGYGQEDRFQVIGHELSTAQTQWVGRDEALLRLEELEYTPVVKPLSVVAGRQKQSFAREDGQPVAWMISDFQKSIFDLSGTDTTQKTNLLPLRGVQEKNVAVDTAWFESPVLTLNQNAALHFTIRNYANEDADNIRVTIDIDGQERPEGTIDLPAGQQVTDTSMITVLKGGWHRLAIRISDYPVTFDDTYFITFYVPEFLKVLSINEVNPNPRIGAVFGNDNYFVYENANSTNIPYDRIAAYNLIILNELTTIPTGLIAALRTYTGDGGNVLFIPSASASPTQYASFLLSTGASEFIAWKEGERIGGRINTDAFVYKDVFTKTSPNMRLPKVQGSFTTASTGSKGQSLISYRDGGDLATFFPSGKGSYCVLSSPLDEKINDFVLQPELFVPLLYKLSIYAADFSRLSYVIGQDHLIPEDNTVLSQEKEVRITGPEEFIPGITPLGSKLLIDVQGQINVSGIYDLIMDERVIHSFAFNYDRKESDLEIADMETISDSTGLKIWTEPDETDLTELISSNRQGKPLWKWCVLLALLFLATEIALIRLWKL